MEHIKHWLSEGPQTRITDLIKECAMDISRMKCNAQPKQTCSKAVKAAYNTIRYINALPETEKTKYEIFRKRDAHTIIEQGIFPTCSDIAVVFRTLMITQGIPSSYVETFHGDYLFNGVFRTHSFVSIWNGNKFLIVDPSRGKIFSHEEQIFPYITAAEGLDPWSLGLKSYTDLHKLRKTELEELIEKYEVIAERLMLGIQRK